MNDAYDFRPHPSAVAVLRDHQHHTPTCRSTRKKQKRDDVCFCDLPAHLRQIQDEAMTAASQAVINWFAGTLAMSAESYPHRLSPTGAVRAVELTAVAGLVERARAKFRA